MVGPDTHIRVRRATMWPNRPMRSEERLRSRSADRRRDRSMTRDPQTGFTSLTCETRRGDIPSPDCNTPMNVLNIVTNQNINFFKNQVGELNQRGIRSSVITPRQQRADELGSAENSRSVLDYVPLYGESDKERVRRLRPRPRQQWTHCSVRDRSTLSPDRPLVVGIRPHGKIRQVEQVLCQILRRNYRDERSDERRTRTGCPRYSTRRRSGGISSDSTTIRSRGGRLGTGRKHVLFLYDPRREVKNYPLAERVVDRVNDEFTEQIELQVPFPIDHEMVPMYMNAADVLLMTSRREGSPNTIKEALACNLPVVATDVGDVSERVSGVELSYACTDEEGLTEKLRLVLEQEARSNGRSHARDLSLRTNGRTDRISVRTRPRFVTNTAAPWSVVEVILSSSTPPVSAIFPTDLWTRSDWSALHHPDSRRLRHRLIRRVAQYVTHADDWTF